MNNPIKIIKDDHRMVESLFSKYEKLGDDASKNKKSLAHDITTTIALHIEMEEKLFYPKLKEKFNKKDNQLVEEAYVEHEVANRLIADIESMDSVPEQFDAKVKVLKEIIDHHVKEEEDELLPKAKKELSKEEQKTLAEQMEAFILSQA